jgi:hypothetical protein
MIAAQIESIFADVMAAKLPARTVYAYQSRNEELGDFAVIVEAAPEEVWLRDAAGRAQGWMIALAVNVLGYVEDVKADEEAFRELCEEAREALHNLTDEEVEAALKQHPAVFDAVVVGTPNERWGEQVTALVQVRPGMSVEAADVVTFSRTLVSDYKSPKAVLFVDQVVRTPVGKADYQWAKSEAVRLLNS